MFTVIARKSDGTLVSWGEPTAAMVTALNYRSMPAGIANVQKLRGAISAGYAARKSDGCWVIWGGNTYAQADIPAFVDQHAIADMVLGQYATAAILGPHSGPYCPSGRIPTATPLAKTSTRTATAIPTITPKPSATPTKSKTPLPTATATKSHTPTKAAKPTKTPTKTK